MHDMLVTPSELHTWMKEQEVRIFDCRFSLAEKQLGRHEYTLNHIPGAFYLDLEQDLSAAATIAEGRHPLPNPVAFAALLSKYGVSDTTSVVFYDNGQGMAARGWWLTRYIGHERVYLLDGGYERWQSEDYPVTSAVVDVEPASLTVSVQEHMIASETEVEAVVAGTQPGLLVDARAGARFRGDSEPIDAKAGHIPGALNAPWNDALSQDGTWLRDGQQRSRFADCGETGENVIHYCGSGVTACNNIFAMELSGMGPSRLFPGSWSQWSGKDRHPVATGED